MDVAWLESLLALTAHGSFSRAADALHVSQPAFSRRIRSLEQWMGAELVDRATYPVTLTPAGVKLHRHAAHVVADLASVREEVRGRQLMSRQAVRIAVTHTLATRYFARWWNDLADGDTELTCLLLASNTLEAYDALLHGGCDLLLAYADPVQPLAADHGELESLTVARDRFAPYSRADDGRPWFTLPGTTRQPVPYVSHGQGAFLGRVTSRLMVDDRLYLRPVVQTDLTSALADLVLAGVGIGWLPETLVAAHVADGSVAQVGDDASSAELQIRLYRRADGRHPNPQTDEVWTRARTVAVSD